MEVMFGGKVLHHSCTGHTSMAIPFLPVIDSSQCENQCEVKICPQANEPNERITFQ